MTKSWPDRARRPCKAAGAHWLPAGALLLLAACSQPPPPPPAPTIANVELSAASNVNATPEGEGAPVAVRIYQLASKAAFEGAEFHRLYDSDTATLGGDLFKKDELLLIPGGSKSLTLNPADNVRALGVFAAYRDFPNVTWRADCDLPAHQTTAVTVTAEHGGIKLVAAPAKPAGH